MEPFKKAARYKEKTDYCERDRNKYDGAAEWIQPFNNDPYDRSPTTSSKTHKPRGNNTFFPRPPKPE